MKDLLYGMMMGISDEDTFLSLAGRLSRFDKQISSDERKRFIELAGKDTKTVVHELLEAHDQG